MALLNYSTTINSAKTVAEIQTILAKQHAKAIMVNYENGEVIALSFQVDTAQGLLAIKLPVNWKAVEQVLRKQHVPTRFQTREQAVKVAWRIMKDWVEAQMAILETEMVKMEQVFLPYVITGNGQTLFERMVDSKFLLESSKEG